MLFSKTTLKDVYLVELEQRQDSRGAFARAWCENEFAEQGIPMKVVQANLAHTVSKGTLRGLHYQVAPYAEAKLMRCVRGAIYDAMIDLRPDSPTYGQWEGFELTAENRRAVYVPAGFAHGYMSLEDDTEVFYMVSQAYTPGAEQGIRWNDPTFGVEWPITEGLILSDKDQNWPDYTLD